MLKIKRVYDAPEKSDGFRILVDRLWPRGMKKERAKVDLWLKEIGPSTELRRWFGHDDSKWEAFEAKYERELAGKRAFVEEILARERKGTVTLLYAAKNERHNNAVALREYIAHVLAPA